MSRIEADQDDRARIYRFALSLCRDPWLADDLAQEAIFRAVRAAHPFGDRLELRKWLFRVTHNIWIDTRRKSSARTNRPLELRDLVDVSESPHRKAELTEQLAATFAEMQRLPLKQREVLHLRVIEGMSVEAVAESLSMNCGAVKSNLSVARKKLRASMHPTITLLDPRQPDDA